MANARAEILGPWHGTGDLDSGDPYRPAILDRYEVQRSSSSQKHVNPGADPNLCTFIVECTSEVLESIESDADFEVMWSDPLE